MTRLAWLAMSALVAGCLALPPTPSEPSRLPAAPQVSPSPTQLAAPVMVLCPVGEESRSTPPPINCPAAAQAALAAVHDLGYSVDRIEVLPAGHDCTFPFNQPIACIVVPGGPAAYVFFSGTPKVAALTLSITPDGAIAATRVAFEVPWSGFRDPASSPTPIT